MSMSRTLSSWIWLLGREEPRGLRQRLFEICICNVVPQVMLGITAAMMATGAMLSENLVEASNPMNMACGFYSCIGANITFFRRRDQTVAILSGLRDVASQVEAASDRSPQVQVALRRAQVMNRRMLYLQVGFGSVMISSVWIAVLYTRRSYCRVWPPPTNDATELAVGLLQAVGMLVGCTGFYAAGSLIGSMVSALVGQYGVLGERLETAQTRRDVKSAIQLHQKILRLARQVEELFCDSMMHFMLCCFSVPLMSTLQMLNNEVHPLTYSGAFINLAVFIPVAILSQRLTDTSLAVRGGAFHAAFEVEGGSSPTQRRALLLLELAATRPARLSFKGLGPLSLSSAGNALRSWYSFTSVLVNAAGRK